MRGALPVRAWQCPQNPHSSVCRCVPKRPTGAAPCKLAGPANTVISLIAATNCHALQRHPRRLSVSTLSESGVWPKAARNGANFALISAPRIFPHLVHQLTLGLCMRRLNVLLVEDDDGARVLYTYMLAVAG